MDIQKASNYVIQSNSKIDIAKLNVILDNNITENTQTILQHYSNLQNKDGGYPHQRKIGQMSTINVTTGVLHTLLDFDLGKSELFQLGIDYLINQQHPDGFWNEPRELRKLNPPIWDNPTNELTRIWLTANACHLLARTKAVTSKNLTKGITFLLESLDDNRQFIGYFHSNWIAIAIFSIRNGKEDESTQNFVRIIKNNLEKLLGTSDIAWCLHCFFTGGFTREYPIVRKMLDNLLSIQNQDGRWISVDGQAFDVSSTVYTLYILKCFNEF